MRFETSAIEVLEAGATQKITTYVKPSSSAMSGDSPQHGSDNGYPQTDTCPLQLRNSAD